MFIVISMSKQPKEELLELVSKELECVSKERAFPVQCRTKQTKLEFFSSGRLLHQPRPVLPICLRIIRARLTKILKAITFPKNDLDFDPHKFLTKSYSIWT